MKQICLTVFTLFLSLLCGCRGLQSEMQKSRPAAAEPIAVVGNQELRLDAKLTQISQANGFDLTGTITLSTAGGSFPSEFSVKHFALRPSWKGFPGYHVINFTLRNNVWELRGAHGLDSNFSALSWNDGDHHAIKFTWRNQGRGLGTKPEHFTAYDVSVTVSDSAGKRHTLSKSRVPTR